MCELAPPGNQTQGVYAHQGIALYILITYNFNFLKKYVFIWVWTHVTIFIESGGQLWESVFSQQVGPVNHAIMLSSKHLYLMSHVTKFLHITLFVNFTSTKLE